MKKPKIISSFLSGLNVISKKKKKGHHGDGGIFFSDFMLISKEKKKKKVLRLSSAAFLHDFCNIPERGAVNRGCLRFLAGNKNAGFWREKKRRNSQNFSAKMPEKISHFSHFFALIGNTAKYYYFSSLLAYSWPGASKETFWSLSPPLPHMVRFHTVLNNTDRQIEKL